jgi:hypothetical protein
MRELMTAIEGEYRRYRKLGSEALKQVRDEELGQSGPGDGNSIAVVVSHLAGNLKSRFTDFLTSDGEKPWRNRDEEFQPKPGVSRAEVMTRWEEGWDVLFRTLSSLNDEDLHRTVIIRGEKFSVHETLLRLVTHASYHVGQIVYLAKAWRADQWQTLSIPKGKSGDFNRNPAGQRPPAS